MKSDFFTCCDCGQALDGKTYRVVAIMLIEGGNRGKIPVNLYRCGDCLKSNFPKVPDIPAEAQKEALEGLEGATMAAVGENELRVSQYPLPCF